MERILEIRWAMRWLWETVGQRWCILYKVQRENQHRNTRAQAMVSFTQNLS